MSDPASLTVRRWKRGDGSPSSYGPREALEVALARIDAGELAADHIIVCVAHGCDDRAG